MNLYLIFFPLVSAWLWRVAGRGGFPNSLLIRRIAVPYMISLATDTVIVPIIISVAACLPITLKGDDVGKNFLWLWIVGAVYGLGLGLLFQESILAFSTILVVTAILFALGARLADYCMDEYAEDFWYLFEYCYGFWFGFAVLLSVIIYPQ